MSISEQIAEERVRIGRAVVKSKLGKAIVSNILDPILEEIDNEMDTTANWIGSFIVATLRERILSSTPSGREYQIILVDTGAEEDAYTELGTYTASAPGQPPASFNGQFGVPTGTLIDSISFEIDDTGRVRVGIFNSTGTEYTSLFYRAGKIFITEGDEGSKTSVVDYANILDVGGENVGPRPWFREVMDELRPQIKQTIKERLKKALKRATRSKGAKTAIYFRVYFDRSKALAASGADEFNEWWED